VVKPFISGIAVACVLMSITSLIESCASTWKGSDAETGPGCPGTCEGSLAEVGPGCPATFDGTREQLPSCPTLPLTQSVRLCGDLIELAESGGYVGGGCYYDQTSHRLVGAEQFSDTNELCGNSFSRTAGRTRACNEPPSFERQCPDSRAKDAGS
jgi:hypothetical protein